MSLELKGKIIQVLPIQSGVGKNSKPWSKQDFILEIPGNFPKKVCLSLWSEEKINKYDLEPGLEVTASIEIESRENNGRWYTEIRAWKITWNAQAVRKWEPDNK
jgi:hypothetical protein